LLIGKNITLRISFESIQK